MNIDEQSMKNRRKIDGKSIPKWLQFWPQVEAKMGPKWPQVGHQEAPKRESKMSFFLSKMEPKFGGLWERLGGLLGRLEANLVANMAPT